MTIKLHTYAKMSFLKYNFFNIFTVYKLEQ